MLRRTGKNSEWDRNGLLAAFAPETLAYLLPRMELVPCVPREVLSEALAPIEAVYFPLSGLSSLIVRFEDGFQAGVGLVGCDGMVGVSALNGAGRSGTEAVVQIAGEALRMPVAELLEAVERLPDVRTILRRYGESVWAQAVQTAACNGHHGLEQRLARWLLMVHDRVGGTKLAMTQEMLASMLCVHRPSVTVAAQRLQKAGSIRYSGGTVTILDRSDLMRSACECYAALQQRISG